MVFEVTALPTEPQPLPTSYKSIFTTRFLLEWDGVHRGQRQLLQVYVRQRPVGQAHVCLLQQGELPYYGITILTIYKIKFTEQSHVWTPTKRTPCGYNFIAMIGRLSVGELSVGLMTLDENFTKTQYQNYDRNLT